MKTLHLKSVAFLLTLGLTATFPLLMSEIRQSQEATIESPTLSRE